MARFYTYLHCKPGGAPFYVGKGCDGSHKRSHEFVKSRSQYHKNIVAKYGKENIEIYVFPRESERHAFETEIRWIDQLRRDGWKLVNMTNGGDGVAGLACSAETRKKLSAAAKLQWLDKNKLPTRDMNKFPKQIIKITKPRAPMTEEARAKISAAAKGRKASEETKAKISAALKGRIISTLCRERIRETWLGRKHTDEAKRKISIAATGRKASAEARAKMSASHNKRHEKIMRSI